VISTSTDTGFEEAQKRFADLPVFYWPFDFSWAVRGALRRIRPDLVVLAEGELWPNFLAAAHARGIPVAVINGRLSPGSFRRYQCLGAWSRRLLELVDLFAVQTEEYATQFRVLHVPSQRIHVTGSVKYDGVNGDRSNPRTEELRRLFRVEADSLIWVAGSTQAPEEELAVNIFRRIQAVFPQLRLFLVPRQRDRFEEVAALLGRLDQPFLRRSRLTRPAEERDRVVLIDTIGELGALWGLADVAVVGGSFDGRRGGQNMIEPAAYGAAVVFGPHVWNFRDPAARLVASGAAIQVGDSAALEDVVRRLLGNPDERRRLGDAAQGFVRSQQGATERTIELLERIPIRRFQAA
jgi:3-deoxy-D-manno-octulosonic-acid transferase